MWINIYILILQYFPTYFIFRDLKTTLLDAERYKEELRDLLEVIAEIEAKIEKTRQELTKAKEELRKLRMQLAMPSGRQGRPKINKDTKVGRMEVGCRIYI